MSALAHWLEEEGIATTLIALVRLHAEKVRPPRALWVPFELGRPLGPPNDPAFQRKVLATALRLLDSDGPPGTIVDYDEEDPDAADDPSWVCPELAGARDIASEVAALRVPYDNAVARFGRTTVVLRIFQFSRPPHSWRPMHWMRAPSDQEQEWRLRA